MYGIVLNSEVESPNIKHRWRPCTLPVQLDRSAWDPPPFVYSHRVVNITVEDQGAITVSGLIHESARIISGLRKHLQVQRFADDATAADACFEVAIAGMMLCRGFHFRLRFLRCVPTEKDVCPLSFWSAVWETGTRREDEAKSANLALMNLAVQLAGDSGALLILYRFNRPASLAILSFSEYSSSHTLIRGIPK